MKTLPLLILFLAVLVNQSLTQTNTVINSLEKVTTERLPIPRDLPMLGAKTYQFSKTAARQIEIKFFNGQNEQIATSTLSENVMDSSVTVTLAESSGQDWVKISKSQVAGELQISAITSSGTELLSKAAVTTLNIEAKTKAESISFKTDTGTWQNFLTNGTGSPEQRLALFQAVRLEEDRLYSTDRLRKIRELLRGLDVLRSNASDTESAEKLDASCAEDAIPGWNETLSVYQGGCGGKAFCFRVGSAIPIFVCDGGRTCTGVYIIYDFMFRIVAMTTCAHLNNCVLT